MVAAANDADQPLPVQTWNTSDNGFFEACLLGSSSTSLSDVIMKLSPDFRGITPMRSPLFLNHLLLRRIYIIDAIQRTK